MTNAADLLNQDLDAAGLALKDEKGRSVKDFYARRATRRLVVNNLLAAEFGVSLTAQRAKPPANALAARAAKSRHPILDRLRSFLGAAAR